LVKPLRIGRRSYLVKQLLRAAASCAPVPLAVAAREETMKMIHSLLSRMPLPVRLAVPLAAVLAEGHFRRKREAP
jgi:hypothetical protein